MKTVHTASTTQIHLVDYVWTQLDVTPKRFRLRTEARRDFKRKNEGQSKRDGLVR
jgi:hypothetical protein